MPGRTMEVEIRALIAKYGYQAIKEYLDNDMKQTYQYLNSYFNGLLNKSQHVHTNLENVIINPTANTNTSSNTTIQDVLLTAEIPHSIHVEKENSAQVEKTVSIANSQTTPKNSTRPRKNKQFSLFKVSEPPTQTETITPTKEKLPVKKKSKNSS